MFHLLNLGEIVKAVRTSCTNAGDTIHGIPGRIENWRREMGHPKFPRFINTMNLNAKHVLHGRFSLLPQGID